MQQLFRTRQTRHPDLVEQAMGTQMLALLRQLDAACRAEADLAEAAQTAFHQHPDAPILLSFPGIGAQTGARVLAEIGDDRARFTDARGLKAYAGSAPITRASGKKTYVGRRFVKNNRLANAGYHWAFGAFNNSPGADAHYRARRETGDWHASAQRHLFNKLLGQLHHCLQTNTPYSETIAFPAPRVEPGPDTSAPTSTCEEASATMFPMPNAA